MDKKVLLIADDEEMNRRIIGKFLKSSFEVLEAGNGRKAMELLQTTHIDALLLDIIMPEMDGLEVLKQMKSQREFDGIGVLVATSTKEKTERTALSLGADDVVSKPYDPIVIKKRLENILIMKNITAKNSVSQSPGTGQQIQEELMEIEKRMGSISNKIQMYADIIIANKDNASLIEQMAKEIKNEANSYFGIFESRR